MLLGIDWRTYARSLKRAPSLDIDTAVADRLAALKAKDFAKADTIRASLLAEGIQLMDGNNQTGQRTTKWESQRQA